MRIVSRPPSETEPARIAPLSVLPVFLDLTGRRALVAGGGDAAAWKAELLAAAGALVTVCAPRELLSETMRALVRREAGRVVHHDGPWQRNTFDGMAVAIAEAADEAEARAIAGAASAAGVPCNVIDRPAFCTFQFGSIVNRSPVVVAISSAGAAPILAQAIRRRIETLLPASLADWAALAARLRDGINAALAPGARRRAFWEHVVDRAFGPPPDEADEAALAGAAERLRTDAGAAHGRVTLVGAGPGDAELLTLKAVRALQSADVILFDDLVSDEVLELARREAKRILVGKRAGRPSCRQDEINAMMVSLARAGRHVVRFKSGDPMIFGRAGEEIAMLEAEGIPVTVVPGITAALAMGAALGVSLTHRDHARQVRFVTGHSRAGLLPDDIDWRGLADPATTSVFYMGARTAGAIAERLIAAGLDAGTPAAVVSALGRPDERRSSGVLADLAALAGAHPREAPVVIGIGAVFAAARADALTGHVDGRRLAAG